MICCRIVSNNKYTDGRKHIINTTYKLKYRETTDFDSFIRFLHHNNINVLISELFLVYVKY